jgi:hypothetical protein
MAGPVASSGRLILSLDASMQIVFGIMFAMATALLLCFGDTSIAAENIAGATRILEPLRFRQMKIDDAGHVVYLDISEQNAVTDETLKAVAHLPHLKEFYAIYCPIRGDGLVHFAGLKQLEKLDLYATSVDDRAMRHIAKLRSLKELNVTPIDVDERGAMRKEQHGITDAGLAELATLPNLETLYVSGTFTDEGLFKLAALKKLRYLEVASKRVTPAGIKRLQEALPDLEITD